jgi:hypothetical protein
MLYNCEIQQINEKLNDYVAIGLICARIRRNREKFRIFGAG